MTRHAQYTLLRNTINDLVKGKQFRYRNLIIADAIAEGFGERLTEDWLRNALLEDWKEGFLTYDEAVAVKDVYMKAIDHLKMMV